MYNFLLRTHYINWDNVRKRIKDVLCFAEKVHNRY